MGNTKSEAAATETVNSDQVLNNGLRRPLPGFVSVPDIKNIIKMQMPHASWSEATRPFFIDTLKFNEAALKLTQ